jgi:hypothetical protein
MALFVGVAASCLFGVVVRSRSTCFVLPKVGNCLVPVFQGIATASTMEFGIFGEAVRTPAFTNVILTGEVLEDRFEVMA